ncbi:MAG: metalloregulator ArsR/SmtB family transcription factor [Actinomycetota bacterium]|nr:metalloregulator ArsR/SmtB family transcription factor [Actinomycetota bacterium]
MNGDLALSRPLSEPFVELVAARLRLLGQPFRVRLIDRLDQIGEAHVQQLADELGTTQQNASKHLTALWRSGVLARRNEGRLTVYWLADRDAWNVVQRTAAAIAERLRSQAHHLPPSPGTPG